MKRDERLREAAGRGSSVGGDPAKDALGALVQQFSERSAFVRELVQNSLDAGSGRVELRIEQVGRRLEVRVIDDGEGMDRATIEGYLLTLFRSNKEQDLTKIGKFGIGFVSLFAVTPELVVVDTARDGVHHRVVFDSSYDYTLAQVEEPFEGTCVTLFLRTWGGKAQELAEELREALHYWCRYARAEVVCSAQAEGWGWEEEEVDHPFTVDAPVTLLVEEPGFRAALGFSGQQSSLVGFYNRGLTLLEAEEDLIPGLTFRVEAGVLEHTLTRDNVRRDEAFLALLKRLDALARGPLLHKHQAALGAASPADYGPLLRALVWARLPQDLELLRRANGARVSLEELRGGVLARVTKQDLLFAERGSPLVDALEEEGRPVVLARAAERAWLHHHLPERKQLDARQEYLMPRLVEPTELARAAGALAADFEGGGSLLEQALCIRQSRPGSLEARRERSGAGTLLVNVRHPLYRRCEALGVESAPFLKVALERWMREA